MIYPKIKYNRLGLRYLWKDEFGTISDTYSFFKFISNFKHAIKIHQGRK